jgi:hypothetical protein
MSALKAEIRLFNGKIPFSVKFIVPTKLLNRLTALNILVILSHTKMEKILMRTLKIKTEQ